jgi:UDP-GlcNAc:undecaprenyl-phosphate/decaprenyl-phosphate GlcNAc-1-phosphate transferase
MLLTYTLVFAGAVAFAIGATPLARRVAHRAGMTDQPSARKVHSEPTPLLGGAAIYAAVLLALVLFGDRFYVAQLVGILVGATLVSFLGLWDDRRPLRPAVKLAGQALATLVLIAAGLRVALFGNMWLDALVTVVWVLAVTNAVNFMDNMDGLSSGIVGIAAGYILLLAVMNDQRLVAPLAAAVAGACIGFLVYNFNPASIFMGDGGSLFLGFVLAALAIKLNFRGHSPTVTWLVPVLVLAVPLFDLILVVVSRIRRRVNPFTTAGKDHLSHRLVRRGATTREATMALYLLGCAAGSVAVLVSQSTRVEALVVAGAVAALALWGLWRFELKAPPGSHASGRMPP